MSNNYEKINELIVLEEYDYSLISFNELVYFGKDSNDNLVVVVKSNKTDDRTYSEKTRNLSLVTAVTSTFMINSTKKTEKVHVIKCISKDDNHNEIFLQICITFLQYKENTSEEILIFFKSLITLFQISRDSFIEFQGLFTELFVLREFHIKGIDLYKHWEIGSKEKFDFFLMKNEKLEVKSTLKKERIHRFDHHQLAHELYNIHVISVQLRITDDGESLRDLINYTLSCVSDIDIYVFLSGLLINYSSDELSKIKFDYNYAKSTIRVFDAKQIPRFSELYVDGLTDIKYDVELTNIKCLFFDEFCESHFADLMMK